MEGLCEGCEVCGLLDGEVAEEEGAVWKSFSFVLDF